MNTSIDEFLAEYYGPEYRAKHYGSGNQADTAPGPNENITPVSNFDIGGDALMLSINEEPEEESLETVPLPMSMLQISPPKYQGSGEDRIVNIRTRRKSISYDILFNETHAVQIRILDPSSSKSTEKDNRIESLEKELAIEKQKNSELKIELEALRDTLSDKENLIRRLEVELARVYF